MLLEKVIQQIHQRGVPTVMSLTGGGASAIGQLLSVPGASNTLLEAVVPYDFHALAQWLGQSPDQACSQATSRQMAMRAMARCYELLDLDKTHVDVPALKQPSRPDFSPRFLSEACGLACTASLVSVEPKRGQHRCHITAQTHQATLDLHVTLEKGSRNRAQEEALVAEWIVWMLGRSIGVVDGNAIAYRTPFGSDRLQFRETRAPGSWQRLWAGETDAIPASPMAISRAGERSPGAAVTLFPGSFNPLHEGHRRMAKIAADLMSRPVIFEISVNNVDKPALDFASIQDRLQQFLGEDEVWLTKASRFMEKAELFPGATFVVGVDTVIRLADPRYYNDSEIACTQAISKLHELDCEFLVFGRLIGGRFHDLNELDIPASLRDLCHAVDSTQFRCDISSTELRRNQPS